MTRQSVLAACVLLVALCGVVSAAVVAIDFGTETYKTIFLQGGSPQTVLNIESERKTFSMVGFTSDDERNFGTQARNLLGKRPKHVFVSPHTLIGKKFDNNSLDMSQYLYPLSKDEKTGGFLITRNSETFTPEEATAMILQNAIREAEAYTGRSGLRDIVFVLPPFLTQQEKKGFVNSAKIAGLNVAAVVSHGLSAALTYALNRDVEAELKATEDPNARQLIVFYDMGASYTTATLVEFKLQKDGKKANSPQVLSILSLATTWDSSLGGNNFDRCVESFIVERANEKIKNKASLNDDRVTARLRRESRKVKEVLSANTETVIYIESLTPDEDYKDKITREEFEKRCNSEFERSSVPIVDLLKRANVTVADLTGIELIGGGGRIPKVQDLIKENLGIQSIGKHLNGDEAAVNGAAFYGALKSSGAQMRNKIKIRETTPFDIVADLDIDQEDFAPESDAEDQNVEDNENEDQQQQQQQQKEESAKEKKGILFKAGSRYETKRTLTFRQSSSFSVDLSYTFNETSPLSHPLPVGMDQLFSRFEISGLPTLSTHNFTGTPKVVLTLTLNPSGFVEISKAEAEILATTLVKTKISRSSSSPSPTPAPTIPAGNVGDDGDEGGDSEAENQNQEADSNDGQQEGETEGEEKTDYEMVPTTKNQKVTLKVNPIVLSSEISASAIAQSKSKLKKIDDADVERKKREKSRNDLEAFIYSVRDKLNDEEFSKFATSDDQDTLRSLLLDEEDWLYDGGLDATTSDFDEHLSALKKIVDPIQLRFDEFPIRDQRVSEFMTTLSELKNTLVAISFERQVHAKDLTNALERIEENLQWIGSSITLQATKSLTDVPAFTTADLQERLAPFLKDIKDFKKRPKRTPIPSPTPSPTLVDGENQDQNEQQQQQQEEQQQQKEKEPIFQIPIGNEDDIPLDQEQEIVL